ncbi:MAG: glycosyltransferase family 4 protein [Clostridiales bacterium]|nr:glycosyltransferase family 4 protein [Clostridiales bacterium]
MKIIHVTHAPELYGIGTFLLSLIRAQKEIKMDLGPSVAFHSSKGNIQRFAELGVPLYSLNCGSARDPRIFFRFYRICVNYDVVDFHTHSPWAVLAALLAKKRTIFTFHGALGLRKIWLDSIVKLFYRRIIHQYCDLITFASKSSFERYISAIGGKLDTKKIRIFPYGRSIETVKATKSKKDMKQALKLNGYFVVGTAVRIDQEKKLDRLIKTLALLASEKKLKLVIAGNGDRQYESYLRNLAAKLNVDNLVDFLGYREDIFDIVNSYDLFVLPSRDEPFGLALLEAMALGVPCVVFKDGGGAVDILGDSGFIVSDSVELAKLILKVKKNDAILNNVSAVGKERAAKFDIKFTAQRFDSIYKELINK